MKKEEKYELVYELFERYVSKGELTGQLDKAIDKIKQWMEQDEGDLKDLEQRIDEAVDMLKKERNRIRVFKDVAKQGDVKSKLKLATDFKDIRDKNIEQKVQEATNKTETQPGRESPKSMTKICSYQGTPVTEEVLKKGLRRVNKDGRTKVKELANELKTEYYWPVISNKTSIETIIKERVYKTMEYAVKNDWLKKEKDGVANIYKPGEKFKEGIEKFDLPCEDDFDYEEYLKRDRETLENTFKG